MKKTISTLLFLSIIGAAWFTFSSFTSFNEEVPLKRIGGQETTVYNINGIFDVYYSPELQQPVRVTYHVLCPDGEAERGSMDFRIYPKFSAAFSANEEDFKNNVWDKGHMAPAANFKCDKSQVRSTFTYLNAALQHQDLNRGPWAQLEGFERGLKRAYDSVYVQIDCHFSDTSLVLETGATVPDAFTKTIKVVGKSDDMKVTCKFPNDSTVKGLSWSEFRVN